MAKNKAGTTIPEYISKKVPDAVPVAPCQGWSDECEFCDKRFNKWEEAVEEVLEKVPSKPGIFQIALKNNKNAQEVVDIALDASDLQRAAFARIDAVKSGVADKKSKATKSSIMCRWMTFKTAQDKDVVSLCAHWHNNGVLPRMLSQWPGMDVLRTSPAVEFNDKLQKWCHPQRDTFWKKQKAPPTKIAEVVPGCAWKGACDICDYYFGEWRGMADAVESKATRRTRGVFMMGVRYGKTTETINVVFDRENVILDDLHKGIESTHSSLERMMRHTKHGQNSSASFVVRWMEMSDAQADSCCFLYAHWLNAERMPEMNFDIPGKKQLERNKSFVVRNHDKKWCDEIEIYQKLKRSKCRDKKEILLDLQDELYDAES